MMTIERLEAAILSEVVTRFANLKESTSRRSLLIKLRGEPAWQAIANLTSQSFLRRKDTNTATEDEEYLPTARAFQFCGNSQIRDQAKVATTVILHALQEMYVGEQKKDGFDFEDLKNHVAYRYPNRIFDNATLKIGLYLAQDFGVLAGTRLNPSDNTEVDWFRIGEGAITMANPDTEWDRVMAGNRRPDAPITADVDSQAQGKVQWEQIRVSGEADRAMYF
jgi:hypothetical protein